MGNLLDNKLDSKFLKPNGLYPQEQLKWDQKTMRRVITNKRVAPFYPGSIEAVNITDEECPICMLYYAGGLNRARCCRKPICTECYFSIRPMGSNVSVICPFCQQPKFITSFTGLLSEEERKKQEEESTKVKELERKMREEEIERDRIKEEQRREERLKKEETQRNQPPSNNPPVLVAPSQIDNNAALDIDEIMLQEALRLSLLQNSEMDPQMILGIERMINV